MPTVEEAGEKRFESRVLPMFARRTAEINKLIPQLYLHGLALGDFGLALRGLLGEDAPVSASTVARLKGSWQVTFYQFPQEHWKHLRTTNVVESPFAALRLRTDAAKRYKKVENATVVIRKMLMLAEQGFRRLDAPEKLMQVYLVFGAGEAREGTEIKREEVLAVA